METGGVNELVDERRGIGLGTVRPSELVRLACATEGRRAGGVWGTSAVNETFFWIRGVRSVVTGRFGIAIGGRGQAFGEMGDSEV